MEGPEMSLEQISNELGIGRERTRQIKEKALRKLRENDLKRFLS
jgi:DNA-directed RNA polymerase sigma subunit (sigma70/sigma32)